MNNLCISIQQPEHAPWLGYFHKMIMSNITVYLDTVQFKKRYYENRNKIRSKHGPSWITIPVKSRGKYGQRLYDVEIHENPSWRRKYIGSLHHSYSSTPYFEDIFPHICDIINKKMKKLVDYNIEIIEFVRSYLDISGKTVRASQLHSFSTSSTELLVDICEHLMASEYICGKFGFNYMNTELFEKAGIYVKQLIYQPLPYKQAFLPFEPCMSIYDVLFNHGKNSIPIIRNQ